MKIHLLTVIWGFNESHHGFLKEVVVTFIV